MTYQSSLFWAVDRLFKKYSLQLAEIDDNCQGKGFQAEIWDNSLNVDFNYTIGKLPAIILFPQDNGQLNQEQHS